MARAHAANASLRDQAVRGLARSLSRPAYQRILEAEPLLRRAVPILIVVFLGAVGASAAMQIVNHRHQAIAEAQSSLVLMAGMAAENLAKLPAKELKSKIGEALPKVLPQHALSKGRQFFVSDAAGSVVAFLPSDSLLPPGQISRIGRSFAALADHARAADITLPDNSAGIAAVRNLPAPLGQLIAVQPASRALEDWRSDSALTVTLVTTTGVVLLILGFAFHWQATRAREADTIYEMVRARIDTALNRGRCGLWDWDLARGRIYWSDSMFEILGFESREELLSFGEVDSLVHSDDGSLYDVAALLAEGKDKTIDRAFRMRHARGDWVWLRARAEIVRQDADTGPHLIGIAVDVTEEQRMAERSATADIRLRDAVETISEAFVLWDSEDRLVLCNSKFQQLHSLPPAATQSGTTYEEVLSFGHQPVIRTPLKSEDVADEGSRSFEAQLHDGRWLKISERRTKDGGFVSVGTDITPIKQHEEKLIESEKRLLATVTDLRKSQQTLEYQAQQLAELAQKYSDEKTRAEDANKAKSDFLANMSHELRTPLNAIIGFSEIMESGMFGALGSEKYQEYCSDIRESGRYLLDVINDILDMSKIEAGRMRLTIEPLRLDEIVNEAMRVTSLKSGEKHLSVQSEVPPGFGVQCDRRALKQIMLNLLSNAVKFTEDGGRVVVRAKKTRHSALILIEDSGIGISRDALRRLGRPFEQVESQLTKSYKGSGLGLAIAKSLAELHHGAMKIRSVEGMGTTVIVRLPAAPAFTANAAA
jgi:two-component system cell cycle sensor histidine kinase PleC